MCCSECMRASSPDSSHVRKCGGYSIGHLPSFGLCCIRLFSFQLDLRANRLLCCVARPPSATYGPSALDSRAVTFLYTTIHTDVMIYNAVYSLIMLRVPLRKPCTHIDFSTFYTAGPPSSVLCPSSVRWSYLNKKQRDRAMFRVIEYFAKSPKITQGHSK